MKKSKPTSISRRIVVCATAGALAFSLALSGCSQESETTADAEDNTIKAALYGGSYLSVPVILAKELGYYEDAGLNIEWETVNSDGTAMIATGDLDIYSTGYASVLNGIAQGETNVYLIGGVMSEGCDYVTLTSFEGTLEEPSDFEGLTISGVTSDPGFLLTQYLLQENGVEAEFISFSSIGESLTAVENGSVDLGIICGASSYEALQSGTCKVLAQVVDFVGTFPCCRIQASERMVNEYPDQLVTFMKATLRGYETYLNDPETTGEILSEISEQDADLCIAKMYDSEEYDTPMKVSIDPDFDAVVQADEAFTALGFVPESDYDLLPYLYTDAYSDALDELIAEEPENELWSNLKEYFESANTVVLGS